MLAELYRIIAMFFPRVIPYNFFLCWLIYGGLGLGFLVDGVGACGVGPSGFFMLGLAI